MRAHSRRGTPPRKTSASVPRLMPLNRVSTTTSPGRGTATASRISATPAAAIQSARAITL